MTSSLHDVGPLEIESERLIMMTCPNGHRWVHLNGFSKKTCDTCNQPPTHRELYGHVMSPHETERVCDLLERFGDPEPAYRADEVPAHVRRIHALSAADARQELESVLRVLHEVIAWDLRSQQDTGYEDFRRDAVKLGRRRLIRSGWWAGHSEVAP